MVLQSKGRKLRPSTRMKVTPPPKRADGFYLSVEWRALLAEIIRERGRRCEDPQHDPMLPRSGPIKILGDHIVEIRDGGAPLDKANVLLRCDPCHKRKTAEAQRCRLHGR